ncbi:hypothetical protein JIN84_12900 [Luteolibacter yonseiensis]|uniref:Uncharacterized protein n=1 Tax=Luteolibacter yonseiensis TaxID=1144680 RepID=A0A934V7U0_9BACT|nr:hypothetical protein [Luteolibacter yonseiensis]MBK1816517.1 hypothetical protein [Luteolibacter yonseiensis]
MSETAPESTYTVPQDHIDRITAMLTENGPMASSGLIHQLVYTYRIPILHAVLGMLYCPGTWRIDVSEEHALIGLDSHAKPGDGSMLAAADAMGLQWLDTGDESGCWVPARALNR